MFIIAALVITLGAIVLGRIYSEQLDRWIFRNPHVAKYGPYLPMLTSLFILGAVTFEWMDTRDLALLGGSVLLVTATTTIRATRDGRGRFSWF